MSSAQAAPRSTLPDGPWSERSAPKDPPDFSDDRAISEPELLDGERVAGTPYIVVRTLGRGGMGEVYEVEHADLGRHYALKLLRSTLRGRLDLAARMRDEARALGGLRHPNLVDVYDLGLTQDGRPFFTMELLHGRDLLKEMARTGPLSPLDALEIAVQALGGLAAAHAAGIVHRDVKLENLFLCSDGSVRILDFGVAKLAGTHPPRSRPGVSIGTPRSMAPEQCAFGEVDARTDVYAVGLVLYELIAGRGPFDEVRGNAHALRFAHSRRLPPPLSRFAPVPWAIEAAIARAMAKSPSDRFPSATAMADALRALRGQLGPDRESAASSEIPRDRAKRAQTLGPGGAGSRLATPLTPGPAGVGSKLATTCDAPSSRTSSEVRALGYASTHAGEHGEQEIPGESPAPRERHLAIVRPAERAPASTRDAASQQSHPVSVTLATVNAQRASNGVGRTVIAACIAISVVAMALAGAALEIAADEAGATHALRETMTRGCMP